LATERRTITSTVRRSGAVWGGERPSAIAIQKKEMLYVAPLGRIATTGYVRLSRLAEITQAIDGSRGGFRYLLVTVIAFLLIALLFSLKMLSPSAGWRRHREVRTGSVFSALRIELG
jgi:hypothetical protein